MKQNADLCCFLAEDEVTMS